LQDLVITLDDGSELDIQQQFGGLGWIYNVGTFQFQDANHTTVAADQIDNLIFENEEATPGAVVHGYQAGQTFDGHGGNNTLQGVGGGNTFLFNHGYGHELVISNNGPDVVQLGAGITPGMVEVSLPVDAHATSPD